ncbi:hypothetical protein P3S67_010568 [Capsicum chacoense]
MEKMQLLMALAHQLAVDGEIYRVHQFALTTHKLECANLHLLASLTIHWEKVSPSASFLADRPVAPYPGGSFVGTLAPSSSSSDLRPELVSGSSKEVFSTQASSIIATSNPVGSMFSKVLYEDGDM